MFSTHCLEQGCMSSYDIKVTNEDRLYRSSLYHSLKDRIRGFNFMIDNIIPGILQRSFNSNKSFIKDIKGVEITFPHFTDKTGTYLNTPFISRVTGISYMCDIWIHFRRISVEYSSITTNIESKKVGSFHCLIGCNRDISSITPDDIIFTEEWKMIIGECPASPGSYIINNGGEKDSIDDEKLRTDTYLTFITKGENPSIETRITCLNNSITSLVRLKIGKNRPTIKILFTHLRSAVKKVIKTKHYPLYYVFYLLHKDYIINTGDRSPFPINDFELLISSYADKSNRSKIIAYLQVSKQKFIQNFMKYDSNRNLISDDDAIIKYYRHKCNPNGLASIVLDDINIEAKRVRNLLFIQCDNNKDKIANLCTMVCQTILSAIGVREYDSRDDWGMKKVGTLVELISKYVATNVVECIVEDKAVVPFSFGKGDKKDTIIETRKCETINAAIGEKDKITNQVDVRTNSITLREVSQNSHPVIDPAKTPEGEKCGLNKQKAALTHVSDNQEYTINKDLVINDLLNPIITYFSNVKTPEFRYMLCISQCGNFEYISFNSDRSNIFVSKRIITLIKGLVKAGLALYYIDEFSSVIYINFDVNVPLSGFLIEMNGGNLGIYFPTELYAQLYACINYTYNIHFQPTSLLFPVKNICDYKLSCGDFIFKDKSNNNLYVSDLFIEILSSALNSDDDIIKNGDVYTINTNKKTFRCELNHWSGAIIICNLPEYLSKALRDRLLVINKYVSLIKKFGYNYSFTNNGNVLNANVQTFLPNLIWVNGQELTKYLKSRRSSGDLPYDSCIHINEKDCNVQYFTDPGRLMHPLLVVDSDGELVIDKKQLWGIFKDNDYEKSKYRIEELYNSHALELIDSKEMDTTLLAEDLRECRNIHKLRKFLNSIQDTSLLPSNVYQNVDHRNLYKNDDYTNVKIHGNSYEIEFTKIKPSYESLSFIHNNEIYYGCYLINKTVYKPYRKNIHKLIKPNNALLMNNFYMVYIKKGNAIFITEKDKEIMNDGDNIYLPFDSDQYYEEDQDDEMQNYEKFKLYYVHFPKGKDIIYVNDSIEIININEFTNDTENEIVNVHNGKIIPEDQIIDKHFYFDGEKYHLLDVYEFDKGFTTGYFVSTTVKINEYISIDNKDVTYYTPSIKEDKDDREAKLYIAIIRNNIEILDIIPDIIPENINDKFNILMEMSKTVGQFSNKSVLDILRNYLNSGRFTFTHCLIDPNSAYSVIANFVPKADSNPGPRFTYQCSMGTQALGVNNVIYYRRYETSHKRLITPMEHSFETVAELPLNQVTMPVTQNLAIIVAANYKGFEDPIILSIEAIKKFGRYEKEICIKITESSDELICFPRDDDGNFKSGSKYRHLDQDGIPILGSYIKFGDCIIGKCKQANSKQVNSSYMAGYGDEGVVTNILIAYTEGLKKYKSVTIKLCQRRLQQPGDKMASRYSQKGTIGDIIGGMIDDGDERLRIVDDCLMPFVCGGPNHGMRAEIIFNPTSFPSRMTMGLIKEILTSKAALYIQEKIDATNFHQLDIEYYQDALWENQIIGEDEHLDINGNELMCHSDGEIIMDSTTGYPMKFYFGIVAYQFLRHHVEDKQTARSTGTYKPITHQPNEGKSKGGGQRMGEMERDSLTSSGASAVLYDRFMKASDEYTDVYCTSCKNNSSISPIKNNMCIICEKFGTLVTVKEPRIYKVFCHQMNAVGLDIKEELKPVDDFQLEIYNANLTSNVEI